MLLHLVRSRIMRGCRLDLRMATAVRQAMRALGVLGGVVRKMLRKLAKGTPAAPVLAPEQLRQSHRQRQVRNDARILAWDWKLLLVLSPVAGAAATVPPPEAGQGSEGFQLECGAEAENCDRYAIATEATLAQLVTVNAKLEAWMHLQPAVQLLFLSQLAQQLAEQLDCERGKCQLPVFASVPLCSMPGAVFERDLLPVVSTEEDSDKEKNRLRAGGFEIKIDT
eukprot:s5856_g1.t1